MHYLTRINFADLSFYSENINRFIGELIYLPNLTRRIKKSINKDCDDSTSFYCIGILRFNKQQNTNKDLRV